MAAPAGLGRAYRERASIVFGRSAQLFFRLRASPANHGETSRRLSLTLTAQVRHAREMRLSRSADKHDFASGSGLENLFMRTRRFG
jgi:hypothetical protein